MNKATIIVLNDFREISVGKKDNFKLYVIISSEVVELGPVWYFDLKIIKTKH